MGTKHAEIKVVHQLYVDGKKVSESRSISGDALFVCSLNYNFDENDIRKDLLCAYITGTSVIGEMYGEASIDEYTLAWIAFTKRFMNILLSSNESKLLSEEVMRSVVKSLQDKIKDIGSSHVNMGIPDLVVN